MESWAEERERPSVRVQTAIPPELKPYFKGVLALRRAEFRGFKKLGIRLGRWQKWVGVGEIE